MMDSMETNLGGPSVELQTTSTSTSNEDVLVVLQTETGEQIALPMSALPSPPHKKQKRKETLLTRTLNEEDMELEFQIIEEPSPMVPEVEVKRKPRKEYRTKKKVRLAMEKLSKEELASVTKEMEIREKGIKRKRQDLSKKDTSIEETDIEEETKAEEDPNKEPNKEDIEKVEVKIEEPTKEEAKKECTKGSKREMPRRELPKSGMKEKSNEPAPKPQPKQQQQQQPHLQPERRTRLSNQCRVATGKSYECNDCDFSTDRINNIILHVKESCPMLKKTNL